MFQFSGKPCPGPNDAGAARRQFIGAAIESTYATAYRSSDRPSSKSCLSGRDNAKYRLNRRIRVLIGLPKVPPSPQQALRNSRFAGDSLSTVRTKLTAWSAIMVRSRSWFPQAEG